MAPCTCTPPELLEHEGHKPGCIYATARVQPQAPYSPPTIEVIDEGSVKYPIAHALALLVRARPHCPADLAGAITAFIHPPETLPAPAHEVPPAADTSDLPDDEDALPDLTAFTRLAGSTQGARLQTGAVMPAPPPPAPSFTFPKARATKSPPYSNGCAHPGTRLQRAGLGVSCLDCGTDFPGFRLSHGQL